MVKLVLNPTLTTQDAERDSASVYIQDRALTSEDG